MRPGVWGVRMCVDMAEDGVRLLEFGYPHSNSVGISIPTCSLRPSRRWFFLHPNPATSHTTHHHHRRRRRHFSHAPATSNPRHPASPRLSTLTLCNRPPERAVGAGCDAREPGPRGVPRSRTRRLGKRGVGTFAYTRFGRGMMIWLSLRRRPSVLGLGFGRICIPWLVRLWLAHGPVSSVMRCATRGFHAERQGGEPRQAD